LDYSFTIELEGVFMARDPYFDILFEPVKIGPVTTKNRFYQVPHCTGMGNRMPNSIAGLREVKAEGGWGVVNSELCSIHVTSDDTPYPNASIWDDADIAANALMVDKVHEHGALAGVELWHGGASVANMWSREAPLGAVSGRPIYNDPLQSRIVSASDVKEIRRWYVAAAKRAKTAGFDIICIYATHDYLIQGFLSRGMNFRSDEYGGAVENRARLLRELIEEIKNAVGDTCAVVVRYCADDGGALDDSGILDSAPQVEDQKELLGLLADLPDLWDMTVKDYSFEMGSSRFVKEAALEDYVSYVKSITSKPVVCVGRFTSPNTMVAQVKSGIVDLIGAARPSIADPFLPNKINEGRVDEIRECIGCNICYAHDSRGAPIRCTQNPTVGEEWRRGWHPERIAPKKSEDEVLIVGAGPAGMEAAVSLGKRGYRVHLAEATRELGGRVSKESRLPTLSEWNRVYEYRTVQLEKLNNVEVYRESEVSVEDILEMASPHVVIATGATWRRDGFGLTNARPIEPQLSNKGLFTPDDIIDGHCPTGRVMIFDDDHYYMGSVIAEKLIEQGCQVDFVSPFSEVATWTQYTVEHERILPRLLDLGVNIIPLRNLTAFDGNSATLECVYTGRKEEMQVDGLVMVTARVPNDDLYCELVAQTDALSAADIRSLARIGDCLAPGAIVHAVFSGHKFAREFDEPDPGDVPFRREVNVIEP
jgi:dimethylamine/trimethylamine dehydrogenase